MLRGGVCHGKTQLAPIPISFRQAAVATTRVLTVVLLSSSHSPVTAPSCNLEGEVEFALTLPGGWMSSLTVMVDEPVISTRVWPRYMAT